MIQANLFCFAPTYSGVCRETMSRPTINEGENFGLMKTDTKSARKNVDYVFDRHEIIVEHDEHEREEGRKEEETCRRPDLPFVQYADVVAGDVFPELYCFTHGRFFS